MYLVPKRNTNGLILGFCPTSLLSYSFACFYFFSYTVLLFQSRTNLSFYIIAKLVIWLFTSPLVHLYCKKLLRNLHLYICRNHLLYIFHRNYGQGLGRKTNDNSYHKRESTIKKSLDSRKNFKESVVATQMPIYRFYTKLYICAAKNS